MPTFYWCSYSWMYWGITDKTSLNSMKLSWYKGQTKNSISLPWSRTTVQKLWVHLNYDASRAINYFTFTRSVPQSILGLVQKNGSMGRWRSALIRISCPWSTRFDKCLGHLSMGWVSLTLSWELCEAYDATPWSTQQNEGKPWQSIEWISTLEDLDPSAPFFGQLHWNYMALTVGYTRIK